MRRVTATLVGLLIASPLLAQEPVTQEREHVVRRGDTLWDLADFYFNNPYQWPTIYQANTVVVEDPHWIYPEEVLVIPGMAAREVGRDMAMAATPRPQRTVFYREPPPPPQGSGPTVLAEPGVVNLPVKPGEFASAPYIMDPSRLQVRAEFIRSVRTENQGAIASSHPQDQVYLNYVEGERPQPGDRLALVDVERRVDGTGRRDRVIHPKAVVRIVELGPEVMEARIEEQFGPIYPERQRIVPMDMFPDFRVEAAEPVAGGADLEGRILEFMNDQPLYGRAALAFIDLGRRDGVREGDIFQAYVPAREVRERRGGEFRGRIERLPVEVVAELRVVRVTDDYATVRVDDLQMPKLEEDLPVRRIRRIP